MQNNAILSASIKRRFEQPQSPEFDGPASCLRQASTLAGSTCLFEYGVQNPGKWLHDIREHWRHEQFKRVAANRLDFYGLQHGLNRDVTLKLLRTLEARVRGVTDFLLKEELLQLASVLRLLLTGGLFTQSIVSRHKKNGPYICPCTVGGEQTVEHVSWHCSFYEELRRPILQFFHSSEPMLSICNPSDYQRCCFTSSSRTDPTCVAPNLAGSHQKLY